MKNIVLIFTGSLILFLALACEKQIPFDEVTGERQLVVNSLLTADSLIEVQVFKSKFIYDRGYDPLYLNNATVSILKDGVAIETLPFIRDGYYRSSTNKTEKGHTYQIKVTDTEGNVATGQAAVLEPVPVLSFDSVGLAQNEWGDEQVVMSVRFKDAQQSNDYYRLAIKRLVKAYEWDINTYQPVDSFLYEDNVWLESSDPANSAYVNGYLYFSDAIFNGKEYAFEFLMDSYGYDTESAYYYMYLEHISYDFYRYSVALDGHFEAEDLKFFMEVVLVYNNIDNGIGIVGSSAPFVDSIPNPFYGKTYSY